MTGSFDPVAHNRAAWDREVDSDNEWTRPVGPDVIARARAGDWSVVLIGYEPVPRDWFPDELAGAAVLCLASGGGQFGREPVARHGLVADEHHRPVTGPRPGDDVAPDRLGPFVAALDLAVPRGAVMRHRVKLLRHSSAA